MLQPALTDEGNSLGFRALAPLMEGQPVKTLFVTLRRGLMGKAYFHKRVLAALGLRTRHQCVERPNNESIRGMVAKVTHTHTHIHTHTHTHTHTRAHTQANIHIHKHTHIRTHSQTHLYTHTRTHTNVHAHAHTHTCTNTHARTYTHTLTQIQHTQHSNAHTCKQVNPYSSS